MIRRITIFFFVCLVISWQASAQDECEVRLTQATEEFNAGHLYGIPAMLKDCLEENNNREWRQRAYLLLAETYLLLEDPIGAEQSYLNVLWANPEYVTDEKRDPIDLVYLSRKFTATPIFAWHAFLGPNTSIARVIHDVRPGGETYTNEKYRLRIGWQAGGGIDYNYNDYLSASLDATFQQSTFKHETTNLFGVDKDIVNFMDKQTWIAVPLAVKFSEAKGKLRKYTYVGYSFNFLLLNRADVEIKNRDGQFLEEGQPTEDFTSFDKTISNINLGGNRNSRNSSVFLGVGLKYKYKLDYFYVDARYSFGLKNLADINHRFSSTQDGLPFPYVDDDFRLDNLAISVGYIHPLYKPRKLKKARTKSVLRKIEKDDRAN
ncbi:MAG TPA: outer membrane beta-barrel protein [Chryseolinea sp.]|nr:outer membrane beta-barrel protein [Chryseolinea sp.]